MKAGASVVAFTLSSLWGLCSAADIAIDHIEFVQVVQDRDNNAPLIAGKSTVARVFLTGSGNNGQDVTSGISGTLTANGFPETLKTFGDLPAIAPAASPDQNNQRHSLNFLLPPAWTNPPGGNLQVRAAATLNGGPPKVQTASAAFQTSPWPPVFRVTHLEVCAPDADNNRQCPSSFGDVSEFMQKIYPLADGAVEYNPIAGRVIDWPGKLGFRAEDPDDVKQAATLQQIQLTRFLASYYFLLEQTVPPDQLFAWIPPLGGVAGLADFATARNAGLGRVWWSVGNCIAAPCSDSDTQALGSYLASSIAYNLRLRAGAGPVAGGFDPKAGKVVPGTTPDLMSLFGAWSSAATFQALFNANVFAPAAAGPSEYVIIGGTVTPDGSVAQLDPGYRVTSSLPAAPSDPVGTHCLHFSGGAAADYCFSPFFLDPTNPIGIGGFQVKAPFPPGTTQVALISHDPAAGDSELTALTASVDAPTLSIIAPNIGDAWQGKRVIQWTASDPGGAALVYAVQYSADNGVSWTPLAIDWTDTQLEVDGTRIWGGSQVLFRVLASNGLNTAASVVGPITVTQTLKLALDQTTLNFQNVPVGQGADRTLLLSNTGTGPLTVGGQISSGPFALLSAAGNLVIPAGGQRAIAVRWTPTATGSQQGALVLTSSDSSLPSVNVPLAGTAFDSQAPAISLSAASIDFGSVISGQTRDLKFTIGASGGAPLTLSSIATSNARFSIVSPAPPVMIAAGQSADVTVRFAPNAAGPVSGVLSISSNDPARSVVTIAVTGTGATGAQAPSISLAPASLDFGAVTAGFSKDSKFTISNSGTGDLTVRSISSSSAAFTIVGPAAPFTVAAGRPADVTVRFAPSAGGAVSASLTIASNDPSRPSVTIAISGNGIASVPANVLRTIAYHEIASPSPALDFYNLPAISRTGARAAFTVNANDVWVVNTDGSGIRQIDTFAFPDPHFIGISDDGSKVLVWNSQFLRIANADGSPARTLLVDNTGQSILEARLTGDGRTIFFVVRNDTSLSVAGSSRLAPRGVWAINADGSGLRQVIAAADVSRLVGGEDLGMVADGSYPGELDVSINGSRVAFGVTTSSTRRRFLLGVNGDGTGVHVIRGPLAFLYAIGISGDGLTVAYSARVQSGAPPEVDSIRFDGTGSVTLSAAVGVASLQVSNDGSLVFSGAGGNGLLWRADGSSLVELFAPRWGSTPQLVYENADFNRATMNGDGTRFLFTSPASSGLISLATADINPSSLGAAPAITNAAIDPTSIPSDGKGYSVIITAKVTSATPVSGGSAQSFLQGFPELAGTPMTDTGGGAWGGSVYQTSTAAGPRVVRLKMETESADGKRHATAVDLGGFTVR